jgi:hypothetical protein
MARVAKMTSEHLVDAGDRWDLGLIGAAVDQCCFDYAVVLHFRSNDSVWEVRLEAPFAMRTAEGTEHLVLPEEAVHLESVLTILRTSIEGATAFKDGHLKLELSNGTVLDAPPDEGFEAWTLTGPDGLMLVCLPGGEVAVWSGDPDQPK